MGALFFMNQTYRETLPIIDASGVSAMPFSHDVKDFLFDSSSGHVQQEAQSQSSMTKSPSFQAEIDRYIKFWNTEFAPLAGIGYKVGYVVAAFPYFIDRFLGAERCEGVYDVGF